jgi:exopolysaccharide biosynthesis polyprenyl glycosylphosphotransferase
MRTRSLETLAAVKRAFDLTALVFAFSLTAGLWGAADAAQMPFGQVLAIRVKIENLLLFSALLALWGLVLSGFGLYVTQVYQSKWREVKDVIAAVSCCVGILWIIHLIFRIELVGPQFLVHFWMIALALVIAARLCLRLMLRHLRLRGRNRRHLLIVGTCLRAALLAKRIQSVPELGYHLVGFADDKWAGAEAIRESGCSVVTDFSGFGDYIARNVVDEVMVCVPVKSFYDRGARILAQCEEQGIPARVITDVYTPTIGHSYVERFDSHLVLTIATGGMRGWAVTVKRVIDFVVAALLLVVLSPLMLTTAALIRLDSSGPALFVQERMGLNKRRFRLYKFRTMVADAEKKVEQLEHLNELAGPAFKIRNDPRVTRLGRFLRKTSLDELPQLLNVLIGEMSLVGPRPLPVRDYEQFSTAWHRRRFSVKPGITCLWQVMGRNDIPFERWMELDMQYIDQWSLLLDLQILLKTIPAVVRGAGAY